MRIFPLAVALAALLGTTAVSSAAFSDDFSVSQATSTNNTSAGFDTGSTLLTSYGSRQIQTDILSNTAPGDARGRTAILNGSFSYSSDDGVTGLGYLTYSFSTPISLTLSPLAIFTLLGNDDNGALRISVYDSNQNVATTNYSLTRFTAGNGPAASAQFVIPVNYVGVNSASVSKLVFSFGGTMSEDLSVDAFQIVPEPGTLSIMAVLGGLAGVGLLVRRPRTE